MGLGCTLVGASVAEGPSVAFPTAGRQSKQSKQRSKQAAPPKPSCSPQAPRFFRQEITDARAQPTTMDVGNVLLVSLLLFRDSKYAA